MTTPHDQPREPGGPLRDDSAAIISALGSAAGGPPLAAPVGQSASATRYLGHHQFSADTEKDFYDFTESDYRHNTQFASKADAKDAYALLNDGFDTGIDGISENDRARIAAGVLDPAALAAATGTHHNNAGDLQRFAQQVGAGDTKAVATADEVLARGEAGLQFFRWFYRAYHLYTGGGEPVDQLENGYHAEQGMSFAAFVDDAALLAGISQALDDRAWQLSAAASTLQSSWQGAAAANFGATMQVFSAGARTVTTDLAVVGQNVSALVQGLEQLVISKAQAVNQLFLAHLPDQIDGGLAYTFAKVAMGRGEDPERRVVLGLLGMDMTGRHEFWAGDAGNDWSSGDSLSDDSRRAADQAAADWCNEVLVPEYEARQDALNSINAKTAQLIQQGFTEFTGQLQHIADPFAGMDRAAQGSAPMGSPTAGGATRTGGGLPGGGLAGGGMPGGGMPGGGLPGGEVPIVPAGLTSAQHSTAAPAGLPGGVPAHDIHRNADSSVSLGRREGLTIGREHVLPDHAGAGAVGGTAGTPPPHTGGVGPGAGIGAGGAGGVAGPGGGAGVVSSGAGAGGAGGAGFASGPAVGHHSGGAHLAEGTHVGADNTTTTGTTDSTTANAMPGRDQAPAAAPVAGSVGGGQAHDQQGGVGAVPFGGAGARGAGGSQEQESARRYPQRGELIGEDELEQWQRMGPVVGEQ